MVPITFWAAIFALFLGFSAAYPLSGEKKLLLATCPNPSMSRSSHAHTLLPRQRWKPTLPLRSSLRTCLDGAELSYCPEAGLQSSRLLAITRTDPWYSSMLGDLLGCITVKMNLRIKACLYNEKVWSLCQVLCRKCTLSSLRAWIPICVI
ncbi:hypothetical protein F4777DRAFT_53755 [Nemania sp. FL0916]|nr:hypothetical protein F4777DRAFT_53755 [Nemania sp. FL0916]